MFGYQNTKHTYSYIIYTGEHSRLNLDLTINEQYSINSYQTCHRTSMRLVAVRHIQIHISNNIESHLAFERDMRVTTGTLNNAQQSLLLKTMTQHVPGLTPNFKDEGECTIRSEPTRRRPRECSSQSSGGVAYVEYHGQMLEHSKRPELNVHLGQILGIWLA